MPSTATSWAWSLGTRRNDEHISLILIYLLPKVKQEPTLPGSTPTRLPGDPDSDRTGPTQHQCCPPTTHDQPIVLAEPSVFEDRYAVGRP